jgi:hypothetical protein
MKTNLHQGSCLCGAIGYEVNGSLDRNDACHCTQCRKWSGHFFSGADVPRSALRITKGEEKISWFATDKARRGFCSQCGSSLFFDPLDRQKHDWIGVTLGTLDGPTGTKLKIHIFTANKGDYYEICDGLPQNSQ